MWASENGNEIHLSYVFIYRFTFAHSRSHKKCKFFTPFWRDFKTNVPVISMGVYIMSRAASIWLTGEQTAASKQQTGGRGHRTAPCCFIRWYLIPKQNCFYFYFNDPTLPFLNPLFPPCNYLLFLFTTSWQNRCFWPPAPPQKIKSAFVRLETAEKCVPLTHIHSQQVFFFFFADVTRCAAV